MGLIRRLPLGAAAVLLLPLTVLLFAFGSSAVEPLARVGGPGRWAALLAVAALAVAAAATERRRPRRAPAAWLLGLGFVALAAVSATWSVEPHLTVGRVFTVGVLFAAAVALALLGTDARAAARSVLLALLAGIAAVAVAGLVVAAVSVDDAVLPATAGAGWRFQGVGQNPNTVPMLLAVGLPIAVWSAFELRGRARWAAVGLVLLFAGEIGVSGSRGALVAGFAGAAVTAAALAPRPRARVLAVAGIVVVALGASQATRLQGGPVAETPPSAAALAGSVGPETRGFDAEQVLRLEDEVGHPPLGGYRPPVQRTFLGASGRVNAWSQALRQGAERPLAGYGFGTEDRVFVERDYAFDGGLAENTYLGLLLQLGFVGALAFAALLVVLAWSGVRACRRVGGPACAAFGVLVAAFLIGGTQSGLLSVGNIAATTVWMSVLTLPLLAMRS